MSDELKTEEEQLEQFRAWWSEYGAYVVGGVVLGGLVLFGWNYQGGARLEAQREASALYDELADEIVDGDLAAAEAISSRIDEEFPNTAYVAQSKLAMARLYMDENRDEDAANVLRELIELKGVDELRQVARLRLSKVLLYQDKADEALEVVSESPSDAFIARFADARGDAHVALEQFDSARAAYQQALEAANAAQTIDQGYVRLKLLDLPTEPAASMPAPAADAADEAGTPGDEAAETAPASDEATGESAAEEPTE